MFEIICELSDFDPEAIKQSKQWKHSGSLPPKKFIIKSFLAEKAMASIFWDSQGIIIVY